MQFCHDFLRSDRLQSAHMTRRKVLSVPAMLKKKLTSTEDELDLTEETLQLCLGL